MTAPDLQARQRALQTHGCFWRALSRCRAASAKCRHLRNCQVAATAVRHVVIAAARSARCVWAEVRWRWTLKVLWTAAATAAPLRHRQTKGAETDMLGLTPPRHTPTLPTPAVCSALNSGHSPTTWRAGQIDPQWTFVAGGRVIKCPGGEVGIRKIDGHSVMRGLIFLGSEPWGRRNTTDRPFQRRAGNRFQLHLLSQGSSDLDGGERAQFNSGR
jgi:hypothetical protein